MHVYTALDLADAEYLRDGPFEGGHRPEGIALKNRLRASFDEHLMFPLDLAAPPHQQPLGEDAAPREGQAGCCDFLPVAKTARHHGMDAFDAAMAVFGSKGCRGLTERQAMG